MNPKTKFVSIKTFKEIANDNAVEEENVAIRKMFILSKMDEINGDEEKPTLKFSITTQDVDRDGDTVATGGWDFSDFAKNPVVLWAHNYSTPPVAKALTIFREGTSIDSTAEFTPKSINEFGFMIYQMYKGGFLSAVSVGFQPSEFELAKDRENGLNFLRQSLMEYSAVPVPSNPNALIQARSFGIDTLPMKTWAENILDDWDKSAEGILMPKNEIELIRNTADGKNKTSVAVKNDTQAQDSIETESEKQNTTENSENKSEEKEKTETTELTGWPDIAQDMALLCGIDEDINFTNLELITQYEKLIPLYENHNKKFPEFRYIQAQVLRHMDDDYYFDYDTGSIEKLTEEIKIKNESVTAKKILEQCIKHAKTECVRAAMKQALTAFEEYQKPNDKEIPNKNSDDQEKTTVDVVLELEIENDKSENNAIFDASITPEVIAEMISQKVSSEMRKRSGALD